MKRLEYSPLDKELKSQTEIAKKQYQKLDDNYDFDKIIKKEKAKLKKYFLMKLFKKKKQNLKNIINQI